MPYCIHAYIFSSLQFLVSIRFLLDHMFGIIRVMPTVKQEVQHAIREMLVLCNFFYLLLIGERYGLIQCTQ